MDIDLFVYYVVGNDQNWSYSIAVNETYNAYVTGFTFSSNYSASLGVYDET